MSPHASLWRNLGAFFGNVARGFTTPVKPKEEMPVVASQPSAEPQPAQPPPAQPATREVARRVSEQRVETPNGPVTLRRTVIDEIKAPEGYGPSERPSRGN